ncbi:hypothetical protein RchiOBHm_Chr6g0273111 [Rosa chinensis]|uniref:Uncharacterized protein n=1 Tax=Rosa chinensis TaxID=74649 RepID=A0A2P6PRG3_ROSCH|nr:hypothetical protein RchiOBHm_Chr6g0273111 [Rosa chinensis]
MFLNYNVRGCNIFKFSFPLHEEPNVSFCRQMFIECHSNQLSTQFDYSWIVLNIDRYYQI